MKSFTQLTAFVLSIAFVAAVAPTSSATAEPVAEPRVVTVLLYADWCASCKIVDPALKEAAAGFTDGRVAFATVDMTTDETKAATLAALDKLGVRAIVEPEAVKTGKALIIDTATGEIKARLTKADTAQQMAARIKSVLDS